MYYKPQIVVHQNNNQDHHLTLNQGIGFVFLPMVHATCKARQIDNNAFFTRSCASLKEQKGPTLR